MLTVNVRMGETESVFPAKHVIAARANERSDNFVRVECYDERNEPISVAGKSAIEFGIVFVMNDNGKTVATYYLPQQ
jgi:hypothetical protein